MRPFRGLFVVAAFCVLIVWSIGGKTATFGQAGADSGARVRWEYAQFSIGNGDAAACNLYLPPRGFEKDGQKLSVWYQKLGGRLASNRGAGDKIAPVDILNLLGRDGWEVIAVQPTSFGGTDFYLKRPVQ